MDAMERKLRVIYDLIDAKNFKSAVKQVNALLQKHPGNFHIMLVKAMALLKSGKDDEALEICRQVKAAEPVDERVLNDLHQIFSKLGKAQESTESFERALALNPSNRSLETALFMAHMREDNYVKQQQVAMKMYKRTADEKSLMWTVCSIYLQGLQNNERKAQLLSLAEAMLKKGAEARKIFKHESLLVYLDVLKEQQKYEDAVKLLEGSLGDLVTIKTDKLRAKADLLNRMQSYAEANALFEEILRVNSDDWEVTKGYLKSLLDSKALSLKSKLQSLNLSAGGHGEQLAADEAAALLEGARSFFQGLQASSSDSLKRGPYLAELEIEKLKLVHGGADTRPLAESILGYYGRFGHLVSLASDLKEYSTAVRGGARHWLGSCLLESSDSASAQALALKTFKRQIAARQLHEQLNIVAEKDDNDLMAWAVQLAKLYESNLHLSSALDRKELGHGDDLLVMVVNCFIEMYRRSTHISNLIGAVLTVAHGLSLRAFNPQHKLLLINLYLLIASTESAFEVFDTMDMKHILFETMSHHISLPLVRCGQWDSARSIFKSLARFHDDHVREGPELLAAAYRNETYSKVYEFVQFQQTLSHSHQRMSMVVEQQVMDIVTNFDNLEGLRLSLAKYGFGAQLLDQLSDRVVDRLTFNEDLATRAWWWPSEYTLLLPPDGGAPSAPSPSWHTPLTDEEKSSRIEQCKSVLKLRSLLPRLLSLSLQFAADTPQFQSLVKELEVRAAGRQPSQLRLEPDFKFFSLLFGAAAHWVDARSAGKAAAEVEESNRAFAESVGALKDTLESNVGLFLKASIVEVQIGSVGGGKSKLASVVGIGLPFLCRTVVEDISILVLLVSHWLGASDSVLSGKKKKKGNAKKGDSKAEELLSSSSLSACLDLVSAAAACVEKIDKLLQKFVDESPSSQVGDLISSLDWSVGDISGAEGEEVQTGPGLSVSSVLEALQGTGSLGGLQLQEKIVKAAIGGQRKVVQIILNATGNQNKILKSLASKSS